MNELAQALRSAITSGVFMPNERLIEVDLAARFHTTRAQIRAALIALENEGLIVSEPNRGSRVRRVSGAEAIEIIEARALLEGLVAAKAAENASGQDSDRLEEILQRMRQAYAANDLIGYSTGNGELHAEIRRISRHATASRLLSQLNSQSVQHQFRAILIPGRAAKSMAEHELIVQAICAHDTERARSAMTRHMSQVAATLNHAIVAQETL
jgi:DNA-binding GntR family transcriptional regulator